jgi:DNA-directed DNA polymerase III PolC
MPTRLVALHVHSWYSLLEGVDSPQRLLEMAAARGYIALAFTDTNNLYGVPAIYDLAWQYGVRPIFGACLRQPEPQNACRPEEMPATDAPIQPVRCTVLISEPEGYSNLCTILSRLHVHSDPLPELLLEYHEGLQVLVDNPQWLAALQPVWRERLWAELIRPGRSIKQERALLETAAARGIRVVASWAVHFAESRGWEAFRLLQAIRYRKMVARLPKRLGVTPAHYLLSAAEVWHRFADIPEALVHAEQLAERCRSDVLPRQLVVPAPPEYWSGPASQQACLQQLRHRCLQALSQYPGDLDEADARLQEELNIIEQRNLAGYFLVVHEIAQEARRRGYPMALRGSAGNSLVCYLLGITDIDPLRYRLPLARFLHAGRGDLPDIDLDFDWRVRDKIMAWMVQRFGAEHTAQVSSHLFFQPRSAFREAAKAYGLSNSQISRLLVHLEARLESLVDRQSELSSTPTWQLLCQAGKELLPETCWARILEATHWLLGRPYHLSLHPGGMVLTPDPLCRHVPLQRAPKGVIMTQLDKDGVERIGLVKIDILGNRALATLTEARCLAGSRVQISETDADTLRLLQRGDTLGVNQLESPAMRHLLVQYQPQTRDDLINVLALIRPAAASIGNKELFLRRRRGLEPLPPLSAQLEPILGETCGLMIFEDQALLAIQAVTGWPAAEADQLRKAISNGLPADQAADWWQRFVRACRVQGVSREIAEHIWTQLARFNAYSFCKSHAVSYGWLAWEVAWYKAHYPLAFWTAALNNNLGMYPLWLYIEAIKWSNIHLLPPCVNRSDLTFRIDGDGIRVGLGNIRGVPRTILTAIVRERERRGPFSSIRDLCRRVPIGPEALAQLIQAGACDFAGLSREELFLEASLYFRRYDETAIFAGHLEHPPPLLPCINRDPAPATKQSLAEAVRQWETLGFVIEVPLMALFRPCLPSGLADSRALQEPPGTRLTLAGLVAASRITTTTDGKPMQFLTLADEWGLVEVTLFPDICPILASPALGPYLVTGQIEEHLGARTLRAIQRPELCMQCS